MAVSGGITEVYGPANPPVSMETSAAVTAGKLVEFTGDKIVAHAASESVLVAGVALQDASASGDLIDVTNAGYFNLTAAGAITQGQRLKVGAVAGTVSAWTNVDDADMIVGYACVDIADTATGLCYLRA